MPSSPPSPLGTASEIVCAVLTVRPSGAASGPTLSILPVSRSVTSAVPSGRKATPHGTFRCLATTSTAVCTASGALEALADGLGSRGGAPDWSGGGGPKLQPASSTRQAAVPAVNDRIPARVTGPSVAAQT